MMHQYLSRYAYSNIGVVGGGQMGTGIAIVAAAVAGLNVKLVDVSES